MTVAAPSLWRQPGFSRVWWAGLISWIGNGALFVALPVQAYSLTHSTLATALVVVGGALPGVVVGQVAGVLVDRWDYRQVLVTTNLALAGVTLAFLFTPGLPWWSLAATAFVQSAVGQFLGPAENALLPTLVPEHRLGQANSLNALNTSLARLIGPALGGVALARLGFGAVIVLDALTYLAAALLLAGVPGPGRRRLSPARRPAFAAEWRDGWRAVQRSADLRTLRLCMALVGFGEGFISTLMAPWAREVLGGDGQALGVLLSSQAMGGLAGAWAVSRVADRWPPLRILALGALGSAALLVPIFNSALLYRAVWPAVILTAVAGLPFAAFGTAQLLGLQRAAPEAARGRVYSVCFGVLGLAQLLGMGVSGLLGEWVGVLVINVDAVTYLLAGLVAWRALRRGRARP